MEARKAVDEQSNRCLGYYCSECGNFWPLRMYGSGDAAAVQAERAAEQCCRPYKCEDCGKECGRHRIVCESCSALRETIKERLQYNQAQKISYDEFVKDLPAGCWGPVYVPNMGDGYFGDLDDLANHIDCSGEDEAYVPNYAWATTPTKMRLDASRIVEDATKNMYEDAYYDVADHLDELQAALDRWCEAHPLTSHFPDFSRAIVFTEQERKFLTPSTEDEEESPATERTTAQQEETP
jgi:hypothetical protein